MRNKRGYSMTEKEEKKETEKATAEEKKAEILRRWDAIVMGTYQDTIVEVKYMIGGYLGGFTYVTVSRTEDGAKAEVETPSDEKAPEAKILSAEEWTGFLDTLFKELRVHNWKDHYLNPDIYDGTQWELAFTLASGLTFRHDGSNEYPENFDAFKELMEKISK